MRSTESVERSKNCRVDSGKEAAEGGGDALRNCNNCGDSESVSAAAVTSAPGPGDLEGVGGLIDDCAGSGVLGGSRAVGGASAGKAGLLDRRGDAFGSVGSSRMALATFSWNSACVMLDKDAASTVSMNEMAPFYPAGAC